MGDAEKVYTRRSQDDIVARIREAEGDDRLGFRFDVLLGCLDFEHARRFLKAKVTAGEWGLTRNDTEAEATIYYEFALQKIRDHRGSLAYRSAQKLREYAWVLGRDDVVEAIDKAPYPQYGAPKVHEFGVGFDLDWPANEAMRRMAAGSPCHPDCEEGCQR